MSNIKKTKTLDMTEGNIAKLLITFAIPLLLGNIFQYLYNTVDSLVVGNFVGKEALAAVGSTTYIINTLVMFFGGISVGASVIISRYFGAHDDETLHRAIETTIHRKCPLHRGRHCTVSAPFEIYGYSGRRTSVFFCIFENLLRRHYRTDGI